MKAIDRRSVLTGILCGAAVATTGLAIIPKAAQSLPLGTIKSGVVEPERLVEEARVTVHVHPRRRIASAAGGTGGAACVGGGSSQFTYPRPAT
jgi:hypothetical protein